MKQTQFSFVKNQCLRVTTPKNGCFRTQSTVVVRDAGCGGAGVGRGGVECGAALHHTLHCKGQ